MQTAHRRLTVGLAAAIVIGHVAFAKPAQADACGTIYSSCINDDTLWPHAGSSHFISVGGTETTPRGEVAFGLVTTYLSRPITLTSDSGGASTTDAIIDDQLNGNFLFALGVSDRLELDAIVPVTFTQSGTGASPLTGGPGLSDTQLRDLRFGFAYALVPRKRVDPHAYLTADVPRPNAWALTGRLEMSAPTGDATGFGSDGHAVWIPSLAADYRRGRWFAGVEVGARLRPTEELSGARIGSQLFTGLGVGVDVLSKELLSVAAEAYALPTFAEQHSLAAPPGEVGVTSLPNGHYVSPAEWMLSLRSAPLMGGDLQLQAGGGGSIPFTSDAPITNPRFRFSLSVRFAPLGRDTDGDGVRDLDDKCPTVYGVKGNQAGNGCPAVIEHEQIDLTGLPTTPPAVPASPAEPVAPTPGGSPFPGHTR